MAVQTSDGSRRTGFMTMSAKILGLAGIMAMISVMIGAVALWGLARLESATEGVQQTTVETDLGARLQEDILYISRSEYRLASNPNAFPEIRKEIEARREQIRRHLEEARATLSSEIERKALGEFETAYRTYGKKLDETLKIGEKQQAGELGLASIFRTLRESRPAADKAAERIKAFIEVVADQADKRRQAAASTASLARQMVIVIGVGGIAIGMVIAWLLSRYGIVRPLRGAVDAMTRLANGERDVAITATNRGDEVDQMTGALRYLKEQAQERDRLKEEQAEKERQAERERKQALHDLADSFQRDMGGVIEEVTSATQQLQQAAQRMGRVSETTTEKAQSVAAAAEQAASNVDTVASASEELSNSIQEISGQISQASMQARSARDAADSAGQQVNELATAANEIGDVVNMIKDIAEQTNLLALNATIEAARAGEAGKGFAVVAGEVKNLANQTTKATDDIAQRITNIQNQTNQAVEAIDNIARTVRQIDESASSIASAIEEQTSATQDISTNVQQASTGTQAVTRDISGVNDAAQETSSAAEQVASAVKQLHDKTETLQQKADSFVGSVKSG